MIAISDWIANLRRIVDIFLLRAGTTKGFQTDTRALVGSFIPAVFLFPVYFAQFFWVFVPLIEQPDMLRGFIRVLILYIMYWCLMPVVAHAWGYRDGLRTLIVARNWLLTTALLLALLSALGGPLVLILFPLSLYWYVAKWFLIKDALGVEGRVAMRFMLFDMVAFGLLYTWHIQRMNIDMEKLRMLAGL